MGRFAFFFALAIVFGSICLALPAQKIAWNSKEFMPVDEIRPGMTGYGKTVYEGTKIERFNIVVIGVLKKLDFGQDMILIRVTSGPVVDRKLQNVEGMSGSPIYINGRLIGAYAYGWEFQQEPIAGVTPIAAMLECTQPGTAPSRKVGALVPAGNKPLRIGGKIISRIQIAANHDEAATWQAKNDPTTMVMTPVMSPMLVSGMSDMAIKPLQKLFSQYNVRVMPGPGKVDGPAPKMEPGASVAVSLLEGDAESMSFIGTVTYVKGNMILAFGHPMLGAGNVDMPLSGAYVHGMLNSAQSSMKLASPMGPEVGTLTSDRQFGIGGVLGRHPNIFPLAMNMHDASRNLTHRYHVNLVANPNITPVLLYLYVLINGSSELADPLGAEGIFTAHLTLNTDKLGEIRQQTVYSPIMSLSDMPMGEIYLLTDALMMNPYEPVKFKNAVLDVTYSPERRIASIEKVTPDRPVAHPGDVVTLAVKIRPFGKPVETRYVTVKVPENAAEPAMAVVVAGGVLAPVLKPYIVAPPSPEEGVKGLVRWLKATPVSNTLLTTQVFPMPSVSYRGRMLRNLPGPVSDLLHYAESNSGLPATAGNASTGNDGSDAGGSDSRPTTYVASEYVPYVLTGGKAIAIVLDSDDRAVQSQRSDLDFGLQLPVLSSSLLPGRGSVDSSPDDKPGSKTDSAVFPWMTQAQRSRYAMLAETFRPAGAVQPSLAFPRLRGTAVPVENSDPLSLAQFDPLQVKGPGEVTIEAKPEPSVTKTKIEEHAKTNGAETVSTGDDSSDSSGSGTDADSSEDKTLLTKKRCSWGLTDRADFLRGKHLGTSVTAAGRLVLSPSVRSIYRNADMTPWKLAATAKGVYLAGWDSNTIVRLESDGKHTTIFPKNPSDAKSIEAITALAADKDGNLLIGSWPDQHVRLIKPDGTLIHDWKLPGAAIWDIAVTSDGTRYVACDQGTLYKLQDDAKSPVQAACSVPDTQIAALTVGNDGDLFLGTAPRGKVYRLSPSGQLHAIYEARGAISSLVFDHHHHLFVGTSPTCRVYRIASNGEQQEILQGLGRGNRHVLALAFLNGDLYAATGPAGGIYRISQPYSREPEITTIYARADQRDGDDEKAGVGPESVMVNALAVSAQGKLVAAAACPAQVLELEPRTEGTYLSTVLQAPAISTWGNVEMSVRPLDVSTIPPAKQVTVETRSGLTALPDKTWSDWAPLSADHIIASTPATFAQFRIHLQGTATDSPALEYLKAFYRPLNQPPVVKLLDPKPGDCWHGKKEIRWEAHDSDDDQLVYTVYFSNDDGQSWHQLLRMTPQPASESEPAGTPKKSDTATSDKHADGKQDKSEKKHDKAPAEPKPAAPPAVTPPTDQAKPATAAPLDPRKILNYSETRETHIQWDSSTVPDGVYRVRVVASDKYAHPEYPRMAEAISARITVDNTPPTVDLPDKVTGLDQLHRVKLSDQLTPIIGGRYKVDDGPWTALVPEDGIFDSLQEWAFIGMPDMPIDVDPGEHKVQLQVENAAGNLLDRTITLVIPDPTPTPPAK